jgi:hypothetical protein
MNRRTILRSILAIPGAAAVPAGILAQEPVQLPSPAKPAPSETPLTPTINADSLAETEIHTFKPEQFSALKRLGEILEPSSKEAPGANDAQVAEFLDFLIGQSPAAIVDLYRGGLDALNAQAHQLYGKAFDAVTEAEAAPILAPLREPWSYTPPAAVLPRFLRLAKDDVRRATLTSREYITVVSLRRRNAGGSGQYWYPVD